MLTKHLSYRASGFSDSAFVEMVRLAQEHGAVNLSVGSPDFAAPEAVKRAAADAILSDCNQYSVTWGARSFCDALADKTRKYLGIDVDPEREVTVSCGSTEAMIAVLLATLNPDDEVIIFEPCYENYGPDTILAGATPRYLRLRPPDWSIDEHELNRVFSNRTKAIVINTPNNPTGKVFSRDELQEIARLCQKWDVLMITDEIYEHIIYDDARHVSPITLDGMRERTIVISSLSKTYSVTGWRVGYAIAPPDITASVRRVHEFLTVGAPAPLQAAGAVALRLPESYYVDLATQYQRRRDRFMKVLEDAGLGPMLPKGAYYIMCDIGNWGHHDDVEFAKSLVTTVGVACVPGSTFYNDPPDGRDFIRFAFCKTDETLRAAEERLRQLTPR